MTKLTLHPETLVSTQWVKENLTDPKVRIVEVDVDTKSYDEAHVPNAIGWAWNTQLSDPVKRDILSKQQFEELMSRSGIANDSTVVIYGDNNNWFAAWAFWQCKIYGHADVRIMNGGRKKWISEGREVSTEVPHPARTHYTALDADLSLRAFLPQVQRAVANKAASLVDVRSPAEFTGEDPRTSGAPARNLPARRPHSGSAQHPLGQSGQRRRLLQDSRRITGALRRRRHRRLPPGNRLLPDRGAVEP